MECHHSYVLRPYTGRVPAAAVRRRAAEIDALMMAAIGTRQLAENYNLKSLDQRSKELQEAQDQAAAQLVALVASRHPEEERAVKKAGYMVDTARNVVLQEAAATVKYMASIRQAISDLGLQYFIERPDALLAAIDNPVYPDSLDFLDPIQKLMNSDLNARTEHYASLPAPAALAAIGAVNAATFAVEVDKNNPENEAHISYLLNIAAAWRQVQDALADPSKTDQVLPDP